MLDTIRLRIHHIEEKTNDALTEIANFNKQDLSCEQEVRNPMTDYQDYIYPAHLELYKKLCVLKNRVSTSVISTTKNVEVDMSRIEEALLESDFKSIADSGAKVTHEIVSRIMKYKDGDREKEHHNAIYGTTRIGSATNDIIFVVSPEGNYIDFEYSIPKYLYGHSMAQFIPQRGSSGFYNSNTLTIEDQLQTLHYRLNRHIDKFIRTLELDFELKNRINKNCIEVRRIDFCYNQFFKNKAEAIYYLEAQKKLNKKRQKRGSVWKDEYETSLEYKSDAGAYFKIYHKGTEYDTDFTVKGKKVQSTRKKHDKENRERIEYYFKTLSDKERVKLKIYAKRVNALRKIELERLICEEDFFRPNTRIIDHKFREHWKRLKGLEINNVAWLKRQQDKILRYEVTIRGDFVAYHYKKHLYRKDCPIHQENVKIYKHVASIKANQSEIKTTAKEELIYKNMQNFYSRRVKMMLVNNIDIHEYHISAQPKDLEDDVYNPSTFKFNTANFHKSDVCYLSEEMIKTFGAYFLSYLRHYQIDQFENNITINAFVENYNKEALERRRVYNELNKIHFHMFEMNYSLKTGKKYKGKKTCAYDLLTESQRQEKRLQTVRLKSVKRILEIMDQGNSLDDACHIEDYDRKDRYRIKKQLKMLGFTEKSLKVDKKIKVDLNFSDYYNLTSDYYSKLKFYRNISHAEIN